MISDQDGISKFAYQFFVFRWNVFDYKNKAGQL